MAYRRASPRRVARAERLELTPDASEQTTGQRPEGHLRRRVQRLWNWRNELAAAAEAERQPASYWKRATVKIC